MSMMLKGRSGLFQAISMVTGGALFLFLIVPIFTSIIGSSSGIPEAITDERIINSLYTSFYCGTIATLFCLVLGVPLAYLLSKHDFRGRVLVDSLIDLPILIPHNAAVIALLFLFGPRSSFGGFFGLIGLSFLDTYAGIVLAMAFVSAPFMVRSAQDAFIAVSSDFEDAARTLGASPARVFFDISLPLASRGILSGCMLSWARAISEFGAVMVIAYYPKTAPVLLFDVLVGEGLSKALPITGLLLITGLLVLIGFRYLGRWFRGL